WSNTLPPPKEVVQLAGTRTARAHLWAMPKLNHPWTRAPRLHSQADHIHLAASTPHNQAAPDLPERTAAASVGRSPPQAVIDLARTRSYVITAPEPRRATVLANLDWYLHEHLGHARGAIVGVPYRTDLFLYRVRPAR